MVGRKRGLGRGLDALLGEKEVREPADHQGFRQIPIEWIRPGKYQPRKHMAEDALAELASSIKSQGLMQPIVLRPTGENQYEIIAGERRWRACQLAGMDTMPAVIKDVDDESAVAMSLIENIQREDLNPMEQAFALQRLIDEFALTHQQVAEAVGKSRAGVTNFLRLLNLEDRVAGMLEAGDLEMGHARALLGLPARIQSRAAREVVSKRLSVRQTESLVRRYSKGDGDPKKIPASEGAKDRDILKLEEKLSLTLSQPVSIRQGLKGAGKLTIKYNSLDELDGILRHFGDLE